MAIAPGTTLIDYISPSTSSRSKTLLKDGALVVGTSLLMALSARASIQLGFTPIPITLQTLVVMLAGATLGSRRGALAMLLYLAEGAAGLPVFAGGLSGLFYLLLAPSAGYLWSYPIAAFVVGFLCERGLDRSFLTSILAMLPGTAIIYAFGVTWLALITHMSFGKAIVLGMLPFLPGDITKIIVAAILMPLAWLIVSLIKPAPRNRG
ncbi:biotin biosynthesis protein BioY [Dictyobacter vulcani]|uniref:Biotin transporter n=1 Tax=Dictyobacter vulcani TaxID=2607529 RepID=A0A5J4KF80_9CHLR|nr:biotin transporter BioY [Dictyobacter vulcani]GER88048.1 biotin biosynthesis protein BioY [Dictyobacter vulcani]